MVHNADLSVISYRLSAMMHNPFTRSGALRLNHPLFRGRAAELDRLEQACLADFDFFLLVYGGRQNGKTTVLLRLEERLLSRFAEGVRVCRVDFQSLPRAASHDAYRYLARSVARVLPHAPQSPEMPDAPALGDFLDAALAGHETQRLVLLLDELGTLPDATREDLAHVLRALHTRRLGSPALAKAQFVLAGGIELYNLAVVEASALRNVCEIVRLSDLSKSDAVALIADGLTLVGMDTKNATAVGQAIYARVSGHPYFTQRLGELLATQHLAGNRVDDAVVEALSWQLLEHSDPLLEHLRRSIADLKLDDAARRLLSGSQRTSRTDAATERLDLLGLAERTGRHWAPRSPLLAVALAEWLHVGMPETDRMTDAAQAVRHIALARYLSDLKLEQTTTSSHAERATTPAEQMRLQRHANEIADEIARIEAAQQVAPAAAAPTVIPVSQISALSPQPSPQVASSASTPPVIPVSPPSALSPQPSALPPYLPTLIHIPAGPFLMGSSDADSLAYDDEKPQHTLTLPDYWIGKTPVTNLQFRPFVEGDGYRNQQYWTQAGWLWCQKEKIAKPDYWDNEEWNGDDYPLVGVSWFEAVAYCRWLTAQTSHEFRLPSEAEWEKAARGTDGRIWPWGNTWEAGCCNSKEAGIGKTTPVSQYPNGASPYGVLDMAGNVWEWVATKWQKPYPYQVEDEWTNAYLEDGDSYRVWRGGSYYNEQQYVRGACRDSFNIARDRYIFRGLRVASRSPMPGSVS
ncbi:MAG: SUMF1/EgtB/PvdO family nonheme iron enzyme [Chloroflexales bacterium]